MALSVDSVRAAVVALYRGDPQANSYLTSFQNTPEAWHVALALITPNEPPEVQFFAASLLVRKVRAEWHSTDPALTHHLQTAFLQDSLLLLPLDANNNNQLVLLRQVCLLQAAVLCNSPPSDPPLLTVVLQKTLSLLHVHPLVALELLTCIAEETEDLPPRRRSAIVTVLLTSFAPAVFQALEHALCTIVSGSAIETNINVATHHQLVRKILRTELAWVGLAPHPSSGGGSGGGVLSPAQFYAQYPQIFRATLQLVVLGNSGSNKKQNGVRSDDVDNIVEAATAVILALLGSSTYESDESADRDALSAIISALLSIRPRLSATSTAAAISEQQALAVAQLGSAVAERWVDGVCGTTASMLPGALELAELMLECVDRSECVVTEAASDYFLMINTVPLAQRIPQLQGPLFQALVLRLLRSQIPYPHTHDKNKKSNNNAEGDEEDEVEYQRINDEDFLRMRESVLPELLQEAYGLLRASGYLSIAWEALQRASTWQQGEAALYMVGAVALAARTRALSTVNLHGTDLGSQGMGAVTRTTTIDDDTHATKTILLAVFRQLYPSTRPILSTPDRESDDRCPSSSSLWTFLQSSGSAPTECTAGGTLPPPSSVLFVSTACWVTEQYAVWFGKTEEAPLCEAFYSLLVIIASTVSPMSQVPHYSRPHINVLNDTVHAAAKAFHALCVRGANRLVKMTAAEHKAASTDGFFLDTTTGGNRGGQGVVMALVSAVHSTLHHNYMRREALNPMELALDDEKLLVQGVAQVVAGVVGDAEVAETMATALVQPFVDRLQQAMHGLTSPSLSLSLYRSSINPATGRPTATITDASIANIRKEITHALHLVAAALMAFMCASLQSGACSISSGGPAVGVLRSIGPPLDTIARSPVWQRDPEVMAAVVEVYKRAVCSARRRSLELLPSIMPAVGAIFSATALPSCLDVLAEAVEIHFQDPQVVHHLEAGLRTACEAAFPLLASPTPEGLRGEGYSALAGGILGLADSFAVYVPHVLWPSPMLPPLLSLSCATVAQSRDAELVQKGLSLMGHVLATQERAVGDPGGVGVSGGDLDAVHAVILSQAQAMADALLSALCDTCPRASMRTCADRLKALVTHSFVPLGVASCGLASNGRLVGGEWLERAISKYHATHPEAVDVEVCRKVCELALHGKLRAPRLTSLLMDFGLIVRQEESTDVLLAYEL